MAFWPQTRRSRTIRSSAALILGALLFAHCSHTNGNPLHQVAAEVGTGRRIDWDRHRVVEDVAGLGYRFPGYLIGIEKAAKTKICATDDCGASLRDLTGRGTYKPELQRQLKDLFDDGEGLFVTHVVRYTHEAEPLPHLQGCFLYNLYANRAPENSPLKPDGCTNALAGNPDAAYLSTNTALSALELDLERELAAARQAHRPYSHILLFSMGWNTTQLEAIRNYNSLIGQMMNAAAADPNPRKPPFRPLFIGLSWPSQWRGFSLIKALSYPAKANDADEAGAFWVNLLLHRKLLPLAARQPEPLPIVLLGHSFGARIVTRAAFSPEILGPAPGGAELQKVDLVIALEGAFSVNRFLEERKQGKEGAPYAKYECYAGKVVLTWSEHDKANPIANLFTGANHVGGKPGFERASTSPYSRYFERFAWTGALPAAPALTNEADKIAMINVSSIVRTSTYTKGGRAHSDIYNREVGELLWRLIERFADPSQKGHSHLTPPDPPIPCSAHGRQGPRS